MSSTSEEHTSHSVEELGAMTVRVIPALKDNYMYLLEDRETGEAAIVDPADPKKVGVASTHTTLLLTKRTQSVQLSHH